jgi:hypothetical protein
MKRASTTFTGLALMALIPLLAVPQTGCDDEKKTDPGTARLRVIHLSPDAPAVDVWVNEDAVAVDNLSFGEGTDYLSVDAGTYDFFVSPTGGLPEDSVIDIWAAMLMDKKSYTVVAYDSLATIKTLVLEDDESALAAGNIRVRAIHTAAGVGEVDIWSIPAMGVPSLIYENVGFGGAGTYLDLPAGALTLGFDVDDDAMPDLIFDVPALAAGTVANVFAVSDAMGVYLLAQMKDGSVVRIDPRDAPAQAELRVVHLSPDAPAVDVYAGTETLLVSDLAFNEGTPYLSVDEGTYTINVSATGTPASEAVLTAPDLLLEGGMSYTAVAYDSLGSIKALALADDYDGLAAGNIRVRAVHTAVGIGTVDIWEISDPMSPVPLFTDLAFGSASPTLDVPAGSYTLGFDVDADGTPDVAFVTPALPAGTVANVFAVQDAMENVYLLAQLADGTLARIDAQAPAAMARVIHLSRNAPAVDIYADVDTLAFPALAFPTGTAYAPLAPGTYDFLVTVAGGNPATPALTIPGVMLEGSTFYTVVAYNDFPGIQTLALVDDYEELAADSIRVRAIHAAVGVGQVDIWEVSDPMDPLPLYVDFDLGEVGEYLDLPVGAYTLGIDTNNDGDPELTFSIPALPAGTIANVFAVTDGDSAVFLAAQLADGTTVRLDPTP